MRVIIVYIRIQKTFMALALLFVLRQIGAKFSHGQFEEIFDVYRRWTGYSKSA